MLMRYSFLLFFILPAIGSERKSFQGCSIENALLVGFAEHVLNDVPTLWRCLAHCFVKSPQTIPKSFVCGSAMYVVKEKHCILNRMTKFDVPQSFLPLDDGDAIYVDCVDQSKHKTGTTKKPRPKQQKVPRERISRTRGGRRNNRLKTQTLSNTAIDDLPNPTQVSKASRIQSPAMTGPPSFPQPPSSFGPGAKSIPKTVRYVLKSPSGRKISNRPEHQQEGNPRTLRTTTTPIVRPIIIRRGKKRIRKIPERILKQLRELEYIDEDCDYEYYDFDSTQKVNSPSGPKPPASGSNFKTDVVGPPSSIVRPPAFPRIPSGLGSPPTFEASPPAAQSPTPSIRTDRIGPPSQRPPNFYPSPSVAYNKNAAGSQGYRPRSFPTPPPTQPYPTTASYNQPSVYGPPAPSNGYHGPSIPAASYSTPNTGGSGSNGYNPGTANQSSASYSGGAQTNSAYTSGQAGPNPGYRPSGYTPSPPSQPGSGYSNVRGPQIPAQGTNYNSVPRQVPSVPNYQQSPAYTPGQSNAYPPSRPFQNTQYPAPVAPSTPGTQGYGSQGYPSGQTARGNAQINKPSGYTPSPPNQPGSGYSNVGGPGIPAQGTNYNSVPRQVPSVPNYQQSPAYTPGQSNAYPPSRPFQNTQYPAPVAPSTPGTQGYGSQGYPSGQTARGNAQINKPSGYTPSPPNQPGSGYSNVGGPGIPAQGTNYNSVPRQVPSVPNYQQSSTYPPGQSNAYPPSRPSQNTQYPAPVAPSTLGTQGYGSQGYPSGQTARENAQINNAKSSSQPNRSGGNSGPRSAWKPVSIQPGQPNAKSLPNYSGGSYQAAVPGTGNAQVPSGYTANSGQYGANTNTPSYAASFIPPPAASYPPSTPYPIPASTTHGSYQTPLPPVPYPTPGPMRPATLAPIYSPSALPDIMSPSIAGQPTIPMPRPPAPIVDITNPGVAPPRPPGNFPPTSVVGPPSRQGEIKSPGPAQPTSIVSPGFPSGNVSPPSSGQPNILSPGSAPSIPGPVPPAPSVPVSPPAPIGNIFNPSESPSQVNTNILSPSTTPGTLPSPPAFPTNINNPGLRPGNPSAPATFGTIGSHASLASAIANLKASFESRKEKLAPLALLIPAEITHGLLRFAEENLKMGNEKEKGVTVEQRDPGRPRLLPQNRDTMPKPPSAQPPPIPFTEAPGTWLHAQSPTPTLIGPPSGLAIDSESIHSMMESPEVRRESCPDIEPESCPLWAVAGECEMENWIWMKANCQRSCQCCGCTVADLAGLQRETCSDAFVDCPVWAAEEECLLNPDYMLNLCAASCNSCHLKRKS